MIAHFYDSIHGFFTFPQYYSWLARAVPIGSHLVEVGAFEGQSAAYLAVELANEAKRTWDSRCPGVPCTRWSRLDLVDNFGWQQAAVERVRAAIAPVSHIIGDIHMGDSAATASKYADASDGEGLDAVFIDADHSYESVKRDIAAWVHKIKVGGIIAGHDYAVDFAGVIQAVNETFPRIEVWRGERWGDERMKATGQYYSVWSVQL